MTEKSYKNFRTKLRLKWRYKLCSDVDVEVEIKDFVLNHAL